MSYTGSYNDTRKIWHASASRLDSNANIPVFIIATYETDR